MIRTVALLFVVCLFCGVTATNPTVTDATYTVKEVDLVGVNFKAATFTYTFDQELYLVEAPVCGGYNCSTAEQCYCDFTNENCGISNCGFNCTESLCDGSWIDLPTNGTKSATYAITDQNLAFRFLITDPCQGFRVRVDGNYGIFRLFFKHDAPASALENDIFKPASGSQETFLCPNDDLFRVGTWFLTVQSIHSSSFTITIDLVPLPPLDDTSSCSIPSNLANTHTCIEDSVPLTQVCDSASRLYYFYFEYEGCQDIMATLTCHDYGSDMDLYGSDNDNLTMPVFLNATFASYLSGDEYIALSLCPAQGKGRIYLTVDCWQVGVMYTNFTLYVSTKSSSLWKRTPITSFAKNDYMSRVMGSSILVTPTGNQLLCDNDGYTCTTFWYTFPTSDDIIFLPLPSVVSDLLPISLYGDIGITETPKPNTWSIGVLLEYTIDGVLTKIFDENVLNKLQIKFVGRITNVQGNPIMGSFFARETQVLCNYQEFLQIKAQEDQLITVIGDVTDSVFLDSYRFQIDVLKFRDSWYGCQNLLDNMLSTSTFTQEVSSTSCNSLPGTTEYLNDPCCYYLLGWNVTCVPRTINVTVSVNEVNQDLVNAQCSNAACVTSFLQDYSLLASDSSTGVCSVSQRDTEIYSYQRQQLFQQCKKSFEPVTCNNTECEGNYTCDLTSHICNIPFSDQEHNFLKCVISNMDASQELYFRQQMNLTNITDINTLTSASLAILRSENSDCVGNTGLNLVARTEYQFSLLDSVCGIIYDCPSLNCEDTSCVLPDNACLDWCGKSGATWLIIPSTQEFCEGYEYYCNWNKALCDNKTMDECYVECVENKTSEFCGVCENGSDCIEFNDVNSQQECLSTTVCVLPNGSFALNMTETECKSYGQCSMPCASTCESTNFTSGACIKEGETAATCTGTWDYASDTCYFPGVSQLFCDYTWETCHNLTQSQCVSCQYGQQCNVTQSLLGCYLNKNVQCLTSELCMGAGQCSDRDLLVDFKVSPPIFGACVSPRLLPVGDYQGTTTLPFCLPQTTTFPNGCINNYTTVESECKDTWWIPATNQQECEAPQGCFDVYLPDLKYAFSPKNKENCTSPYNQGTYTSYFTWTPAQWYTGSVRNLSWVSRQATSRYQWSPTINLDKLETLWNAGAQVRKSVQIKSEALCKYTRSTQTLSTISCDCSDSGTSEDQCFGDAIAVPVTEAKPCVGFSSVVIQAPAATLSLTNGSIAVDCVDLLFSQISALHFQAVPKIKLSSNFATYSQADSFSVFNENKAPIGVLLGDGTQLGISNTLQNGLLCLKIRSDLSKNVNYNKLGYTVYDFATSDSAFTTLTPLELNAYVQGDMVCSNLKTIPTTGNYFPIIRTENWRNEEFKYFDSVSEGFIYTLAVFFLLVTLFALLKIVVETYLMFKLHSPITKFIQLEQITAYLVFLFNFIRSIYFFALPSGSIDNPVADYILVVLPTFLFFTTFSAIIILWAVVTLKRFSADRRSFTRLVRYIGAGINISLYLLFIIIVIIFQFSYTDPAISCGGRVATNRANSINKQKQIAIAYVSIIAIISLAIGLGFAFFGAKMYKIIQGPVTGRKSGGKSPKRLFLIATVGSVSFVLHCIFLLILLGLSEPLIAFSFFGLLITEILPSAFIIAVFWQKLRKYGVSSDGSSTPHRSQIPMVNQ